MSTVNFTIDLNKIGENYARIQQASQAEIVAYAIKANYDPEIIRVLQELGSNIEVMTLSEYTFARNIGIPPEKIIYNGHKGTDLDAFPIDELDKVGMFTVYHTSDLEKLETILRANGKRARLGIRIDNENAGNLGDKAVVFDPGMGLGLSPHTLYRSDYGEKSIEAILERAGQVFERVAVHGMAGASFSNPDFLKAHYDRLEQHRKRLGFTHINLGGGYMCEQRLNQKGLTICDLFKDIPPSHLIVEPGRYIVEDACHIEAPIKVVDHSKKSDKYDGVIVLETGMNLLVPLNSANFQLPGTGDRKYLVLGQTGASVDRVGILSTDRELTEKDTVRIECAGAYTTSMANTLAIPGQQPYTVRYRDEIQRPNRDDKRNLPEQ